MENTKEKMLLAALSQCVADRDKASANISFILEHGCYDINHNVQSLKEEFEKISQTELTMEAIQVYYAKHCKLPQQSQEQKTEGEKGNVNDNNS